MYLNKDEIERLEKIYKKVCDSGLYEDSYQLGIRFYRDGDYVSIELIDKYTNYEFGLNRHTYSEEFKISFTANASKNDFVKFICDVEKATCELVSCFKNNKEEIRKQKYEEARKLIEEFEANN